MQFGSFRVLLPIEELYLPFLHPKFSCKQIQIFRQFFKKSKNKQKNLSFLLILVLDKEISEFKATASCWNFNKSNRKCMHWSFPFLCSFLYWLSTFWASLPQIYSFFCLFVFYPFWLCFFLFFVLSPCVLIPALNYDHNKGQYLQ